MIGSSRHLNPPKDTKETTQNETQNEIENQVDTKTSGYHTTTGGMEPPVPVPQLQPDNLSPMSATLHPAPVEMTPHFLPPPSKIAQPTPRKSGKGPPDSASGAGNSLAVGNNPSFNMERETMQGSIKPFPSNQERESFLRGTFSLPAPIPEFQRMNSREKPFLHMESGGEHMLPFHSTIEPSADSGFASGCIP